jgi:hypothetical protein
LDLYVVEFFKAFLLTFLIEYLVLSLLAREVRPIRGFVAVLIANGFSLPVVWFIIPLVFRNFLIYSLTSEMLATVSECLILRRFLLISYRHSLLASFSMNTASFIVGLILP